MVEHFGNIMFFYLHWKQIICFFVHIILIWLGFFIFSYKIHVSKAVLSVFHPACCCSMVEESSGLARRLVVQWRAALVDTCEDRCVLLCRTNCCSYEYTCSTVYVALSFRFITVYYEWSSNNCIFECSGTVWSEQTKDVINFSKSKNYSICMSQETHRFKKKQFECKVIKIDKDSDWNLLILNCKMSDNSDKCVWSE